MLIWPSIACDVTNKEDIVYLVGEVEKRERHGVDLLVIASGSEGERGTAPNMDAKQLQQMLFAEDQTKWL
jgi:NAD(P)-dependent dehydrogenase (short-subunit alcohol dehydrogenase family)